MIRPRAARAAFALEKLTAAASGSHGFDCYLHAELGRAILNDDGLDCRTVVGLAAWRVGSGDGDAISHVFHVPGHLPPGGVGLPFHAWLVSDGILIDLTTYQLRLKAANLDQLAGGTTVVDWCPQALVAPVTAISTYEQVANAPGPGVFFYQAVPSLQKVVEASANPVDESDLETLRIIVANPNVRVIGPNNLPGD